MKPRLERKVLRSKNGIFRDRQELSQGAIAGKIIEKPTQEPPQFLLT
jgi:hypothetical protein